MDEPAPVRIPRGKHLDDVEREDLESYAVEELRERVKRLHDEIDRTEAQLERKQSGRSAADALFKPRP